VCNKVGKIVKGKRERAGQSGESRALVEKWGQRVRRGSCFVGKTGSKYSAKKSGGTLDRETDTVSCLRPW